MFHQGSLTLLRVRNIPIRAHWTLLLVIPYLALAFAYQFAQVTRIAHVPAERIAVPPLVWGLLLAVGLFISVGLHELAHSLVAIRLGGRVREITLMLVGGISLIEHMPRKPRSEALVAAVGPVTSLALAAVLFLVHGGLPHGAADTKMGLFYLARANLVLGVFNLLPAFPMDGGRVLRALLQGPFGPARATAVATRIGKILAIGLGVLGVAGGGLLMVLVALFLYSGADTEAHAQSLRDALAGLRVEQLMMAPATSVALDTPLADVAHILLNSGHREAAVLDEYQRPVGVVRARHLTPPVALASASVRWLGDRIHEGVVLARPDQPIAEVLERHPNAEYVIAIHVPDSGGAVLAGLLSRLGLEHALMLLALERGLPPGSASFVPRRTREV